MMPSLISQSEVRLVGSAEKVCSWSVGVRFVAECALEKTLKDCMERLLNR